MRFDSEISYFGKNGQNVLESSTQCLEGSKCISINRERLDLSDNIVCVSDRFEFALFLYLFELFDVLRAYIHIHIDHIQCDVYECYGSATP